MRKAITLNVKLYIEGDAPPAQDFYQSTAQAVREMLAEGQSKTRLKVTVQDLKELSGDADEDLPPPAATPAPKMSGDQRTTPTRPTKASAKRTTPARNTTKRPAKRP